jgi:DNA-binding transcriptional MerR regulator
MNKATLFSIGEFSKMTGLTVKTLRFYHEEKLLAPAFVDPETGYRYYEGRQVERARVIAFLRSLELPVSEIRELLAREEGDVLEVLERHQVELVARIKHLRNAERVLREHIAKEKEERAMTVSNFEVSEKDVGAVMVAAIRMKGAYKECGKAFGKLARGFGRELAGRPMLLHHDTEFKENDADFEACFPVRQRREGAGAEVRELPAARCVTLVHQGPYEELGRSYAKVFSYVKSCGYDVEMPTREVYLKGPGMIFRGNPKKYLTEIQIPIGRGT